MDARINDAWRSSRADAIRQCPYGTRLSATMEDGRGQTANGCHFRPQHRTATRISRKWTQIGTRRPAPQADKMSLSRARPGALADRSAIVGRQITLCRSKLSTHIHPLRCGTYTDDATLWGSLSLLRYNVVVISYNAIDITTQHS